MSHANQVLQGDCLEILPSLPEQFYHCCVTSPPYYGLRDYDVPPTDWPEISYKPMPGLPRIVVPSWKGCLGQEPTPEMFTAHIVHVFRAVWRTLRDDGTLWLNLGDSYASKWGVSRRNAVGNESLPDGTRKNRPDRLVNGLKEKDLIGIPWRIAFALQADDWFFRQDVVWHKPNPLPESVKDRCTKAHEYIFLFTKQHRYAFNHDAIKEPAIAGYQGSSFIRGKTLIAQNKQSTVSSKLRTETVSRNKRSVWSIASEPCSEAHYAVMPSALIEPCILAGSPVDGNVLDPFGGAGTTGMVCKRHRRNYTLIELGLNNCEIAQRRINKEPWPQLSILDGDTAA
ncbi:MAG: site-specific DNA-methyltransferase [Cyanobacteria bacterium P01_F01_bin.13]